MTRDATRRPTTAELIAALHEIPKTDRDYGRALLVIDRLGTHEAELAAERAKSADLEALVADLIAAWPDTESGGPILDRHEGGTWWLEHANTAAWPGCDDGPYPTCEAAVMAHVAASEQKGGATT